MAKQYLFSKCNREKESLIQSGLQRHQFIPNYFCTMETAGDGGQSSFMGSLQEDKHKEWGVCLFIFPAFFSYLFCCCKGQQACNGTGARPPGSAPEAGSAVYHQNGYCGPGRAAIYESKMHFEAMKRSVFQACPSLTRDLFAFFFPPPFSELKIAVLLPQKKNLMTSYFFFPQLPFSFLRPPLGA